MLSWCLTFITLVAEVAVVVLEWPAERVAGVGVAGCCGIENTIHLVSWA